MVSGRVTTDGQSQIYHELMRFRPAELSLHAWAVKAGVSRTVWADMRRHGNPSRRTLEKLLVAAGSSLAEFEALRIGPDSQVAPHTRAVGDRSRGWSPAQLPPLPLLASAFGGEYSERGRGIELIEIRPGEMLDRVPRPPSLAGDPDAFAVTIVGESMWPRFRPGGRIAVSPRAPVAIGDDVMVRLRSNGEGKVLIKQLVRQDSAALDLRQFNPDRQFAVERAEIDAIFKVLGELI
jgi:phage repressor protein C with HTH and peptisase S24 domain